jgi:hypothetical protein
VPIYNWTGFCIGGNVSSGWNGGSFTNAINGTNFGPSNTQYFIGGGQASAPFTGDQFTGRNRYLQMINLGFNDKFGGAW